MENEKSVVARLKTRYIFFSSFFIFVIICTPNVYPNRLERIESHRVQVSPEIKTLTPGIRQLILSAIQHVKPALVRIHVVSYEYDNGREIKYESAGSGVIISEDGYVVTNHHVAGKAKRILCTLSDRREIDAVLIGTDPMSDIAVIKLTPPVPEKFPYATFGNSDTLKVGDYVLAMGSPLALSQSVTLGIVSNPALVIPKIWGESRMELEGENVALIVRWIGHDAQIFPGNSGGPLVNLEGKVVGVNEISLGLSGAIPSNLVKKIVPHLITYHRVPRPFFGFLLSPRLSGMGDKGVLISSIIPGSPAEKAGLQAGDVLLKIEDKTFNVRFREQLPDAYQTVFSFPAGEKVQLVYKRNGKIHTTFLTPREREPKLPPASELPEWGLAVRDLSTLLSLEVRFGKKEGVYVDSVRSGGPSDQAKPPIQDKDILLRVNGTRVHNVEELRKFTRDLLQGKRDIKKPVLVEFFREGQKMLTVVNVGIQEWQIPGRELQKAWIGIEYQVVTRDLAQALDLPGVKGIRITRVYPGTRAKKAGLRVGDIITAVDTFQLNVSRPEEYSYFRELIRQYDLDLTVHLKVIRQKETITVPVQLEPYPPGPQQLKKYHQPLFDFTVRDISFFDRVRENWDPEFKGAYVSYVGHGGWASLARMESGDVILAINDEPVHNVEELEKVLKKLEKDRPRYVVFKVLRGIYTKFLEVMPKWSDMLQKKNKSE